ncbi:hypothetical protein [Enterobacter hormaechei]|uniref:hypothetical protein n=1 Tax=Enterobacter hormaechei TaxID=158836 RepID=UPI00399B9537
MNQVAKLDLAQIRQQAINDGLLVDQSSIGKQAGFLTNVAVTPAIVDGVFGADGTALGRRLPFHVFAALCCSNKGRFY